MNSQKMRKVGEWRDREFAKPIEDFLKYTFASSHSSKTLSDRSFKLSRI
ncbi:MAG: hypothetical protein QNJ72_13620 [Pleurocapsa sp. MO_226.B13]|nr:hypothetical protein [Pleurocapsa sp. MO_226.B13]